MGCWSENGGSRYRLISGWAIKLVLLFFRTAKLLLRGEEERVPRSSTVDKHVFSSRCEKMMARTLLWDRRMPNLWHETLHSKDWSSQGGGGLGVWGTARTVFPKLTSASPQTSSAISYLGRTKKHECCCCCILRSQKPSQRTPRFLRPVPPSFRPYWINMRHGVLVVRGEPALFMK